MENFITGEGLLTLGYQIACIVGYFLKFGFLLYILTSNNCRFVNFSKHSLIFMHRMMADSPNNHTSHKAGSVELE